MLESVKLRLDSIQKRLDLQEQGLDYSFRAAHQIIETIAPNMDQETKGLLLQNLFPHTPQMQSSSNTGSVETKKAFDSFDDGKI